MPAPSIEDTPILRKMSDELLKALPKASFFTWHVLAADAMFKLDSPQVYVVSVHDEAGEWIAGEMLEGKENRIVAKYQEQLGWSAREEGLAFGYSIKEAKEITDIEGTGMLDPEFDGRPGLERFY